MNVSVFPDPFTAPPSDVVFRDAMRQLAGGVSVIAAGRGSDISGMTVTSVSSLSAEPPTVIFCANRQSSIYPLLKRYGAFAVNILRAEQTDLALKFSGKRGTKGAERFEDEAVLIGDTETPLLANALVAIDCEVDEMIDRYSHAIVIGRVCAVRVMSGSTALIYWRGHYAEVMTTSPHRQTLA